MNESISCKNVTLGFLGLGSMGSGMVKNLLNAGCKVIGYDKSAERLKLLEELGLICAKNEKEVVQKSDVTMTSLPSSDIFVQVAEQALIPNGKEDQIFIDLGTVMPSECRRLANEFKDRKMTLIDAPVTGGVGGAEEGILGIFVGGDKEIADKCTPIFEIVGDPTRIVYCGNSGSGQIVKGINQLAMGLSSAANLEAISYGVRLGVDSKIILKAVGGEGSWRKYFSQIASRIVDEKGKFVGVKHGQLKYFIEEAEYEGYDMPLSTALFKYLENSECTIKEANRMSPSFWNELLVNKK